MTYCRDEYENNKEKSNVIRYIKKKDLKELSN